MPAFFHRATRPSTGLYDDGGFISWQCRGPPPGIALQRGSRTSFKAADPPRPSLMRRTDLASVVCMGAVRALNPNSPLQMGRQSSLRLPFFLFLRLWSLTATAAAVTVGAGVGVGIGIGGGTGGGGGVAPAPAPVSSPGSNLINAYKALQAWKSAITDDPTGVLSTWAGPEVCAYRGVFCAELEEDAAAAGSGGGVVVAGIDLNHANLQGALVEELSLLTDATILHLHGNRFSGAVPGSFQDLSSLRELDLSDNRFSGAFPRSTLLIPNLLFLDLRFNAFSGPIPEELFDKHLDAILVNDNRFDGQIPSTLGNSPASVINLANNRFTGGLPSGFASMNGRLREILFLNNLLTGCIPEGVAFLTNTQVLDVSFNRLTGHLPDTLSCLSDMEVLNVAHNNLSGEVPEVLCSLRNLLNLTVADNFFSGFSQECARSGAGFDFSSNCIPGGRSQRPGSDCSAVPGGGPNCARTPAVAALFCRALAGGDRSSP